MPYISSKNLLEIKGQLEKTKQIAERGGYFPNLEITSDRICEITELWRKSWIVSPIEKVLNVLNDLK